MMLTRKSLLPLQANRVWRSYLGGCTLDRIEGKPAPADSHYPEDWIASLTRANNPVESDPDEGLAKVHNEEGKLVPFSDLVAKEPEFYLGKEHVERFGTDMRILAKYLDSAIRLHFQVHPTADFSAKHLGVNKGKTEAYVILAIREEIKDPYIYAGFQRPPSREQLKRWIETQDIAALESCFDKIPVKVGDVFLIPGGCPHALGEGILMVELMEASDLVVRFEFERGGYVLPEDSRFMGRGLDFCLNVFDLEPKQAADFVCEPRVLHEFADGSVQRLLVGADRTPCFEARSTRIERMVTKYEEGFYILVVTEGSGTIEVGGQLCEVKQYDRVFIAAEAGEVTFKTTGGLEFLELAGPVI
ncbi:class I mannose-6-phosphate isomerase [Pelagicoccus sp. SDUM812005]|uniref:class I mannose-6-phosphate isomerase n=1 Tax=Pelagicoccus sp. SDUM812005 TaxID=3041257 RepID=UPI00280DD252|nr:class I mannose-6-phosphate isomerase [Pelagicoccus sp. SDUM812005]MDQ8179951.1 class I mannose-6-phosphate isomerase [Pelagicoccus sp. SDUM812005]